MTKQLAAIVLGVSLLGGCYMGRSASAKRGAYVVNGAVAVAGAALMFSSTGDDDCPDTAAGIACSAVQGAASGILLVSGAMLFALAGAGTVINLVTPDMPEPTPPPPPRAAIVAKPGAPLAAALELDLDQWSGE